MHSDVEEDFAARRVDADDHSFGVSATGQSLIVYVNFGWKHFEPKALIVEQRDGISDDHVGELADGLARDVLAFLDRASSEMAGDFVGDFRSDIEHNATFDVALKQNVRGDAFAAIRLFVHREIVDLCRRLEHLRENGVGGIDERLDEFHSHARRSPASATGAPAAFGSSLST